MLRVLLLFVPLCLIACSDSKVPPLGPASKITLSLDAPGKPTNLRCEVLSDSSALVSWDAVEGATDYDINYRTLNGRWTNEPHKGTRLYNTIYDLEPETEYRWAVRAENSVGASAWVFGENFTTDGVYISFYFDGTLSSREQEIFTSAVALWENIIKAGHPNGLIIRASTEVQMWIAGQSGFARIEKQKQINNRYFNTECFIGLSSPNEWRLGLSQELKDDTFGYVVAHEIGHCLGIGSSPEWETRLEYLHGWNEGEPTVIEVKENGVTVMEHPKVEGPIAPSFVGEAAQREFLRLAENQWGEHPYIPLRWSRGNGIDTSHLSTPILRMSVMSSGGNSYGSPTLMKVSTVDAAILSDLGYTVDMSKASDIRLISGYRQIDPGDTSIGTVIETLFFPEWPLEYSFEDRYQTGYRQANRTGRHIPIDDPTVKEENLFYLDEYLREHDKDEAAGKRITGTSSSWCGVGKH